MTSRLVLAGLLTGVTDGLFSSVLGVAFYGSTVTRLFQGVASVPLGSRALEGGLAMAALGLLIHFGVAFVWSAVFLMLVQSSDTLRGFVSARGGMIAAATIYGPIIWMVMSLVVIPALTQRPPAITARWWTQFVGHIPFVALPIIASIGGAPFSGR